MSAMGEDCNTPK